ncbi:NAD(P)H-dependent oxidoreductase [Mangrovicoccus algicola]|uniref:Flagellar biosynthesis protein FlgA n=1 Tax=Mangrovicoccus algicola TaxID=2771008 RepID=A0A8J7CXE1_9RHOB|nr:flagellar biosynthesis protein FlgA [Mangrovicoccus algicola]MBE3638787.1 flagellar biosynthesis protein FlgA [Mangrovicoccus algicola]
MSLSSMLAKRNAAGKPVRVGLIGAGKFGSMVLAQARKIEGYHVVAVADLDVGKVRTSLERTGWEDGEYSATSLGDAMDSGRTFITDDAAALCAFDGIECIIEATGHPLAGVRHALKAIDGGKHVVMVNVEADVMCGPILAQKAREKGVVYSMAYGDQPAFCCELVDWVKSCGFELVASGKGMNFCPGYRYSTPDTVWDYFDFTPEQVKAGDFNPKMYNSFTDGTKAAIEMAAVANATGLDCPEDGLAFHPAGLQDLAEVFKPVSEGGRLEKNGIVDIAASREPDGRTVLNNIQYGMFVTFKAPNEYTRQCFNQYGLLTDKSGWYGSMWRPFHLIGLETSVSVLSAVLRGEPTGTSVEFRGDAVATAKSDLKAGEWLDGEGGFATWAKAVPAVLSTRINALPIGLAHKVRLKRDVGRDQIVTLEDVDLVDDLDVIAVRQEQMDTMGPKEPADA